MTLDNFEFTKLLYKEKKINNFNNFLKKNINTFIYVKFKAD